MTIREALDTFSGAKVTHPDVPIFKLQKALCIILGAARREADRQDSFLSEVNNEKECTQ